MPADQEMVGVPDPPPSSPPPGVPHTAALTIAQGGIPIRPPGVPHTAAVTIAQGGIPIRPPAVFGTPPVPVHPGVQVARPPFRPLPQLPLPPGVPRILVTLYPPHPSIRPVGMSPLPPRDPPLPSQPLPSQPLPYEPFVVDRGIPASYQQLWLLHGRGPVRYTDPRDVVEVERVVQSPFKCKVPVLQDYINEVVVASSELETRACLILTRSFLLAREDLTHVPPDMFKQSFFEAAMRAAAFPTVVEWVGGDQLCLDILRTCQRCVAPITTFDFNNMPSLLAFLAKRYQTSVINNIWMNMIGRSWRVIKEQVTKVLVDECGLSVSPSTIVFIVRSILWKIAEAPDDSPRFPDPANYKDKQARDLGVRIVKYGLFDYLIKEHRMYYYREDLPNNTADGYFSETNMKSQPSNFFTYMVYLWDEGKKGFALVPQYKMKRRAITFGAEVMSDLVYRITRRKEYEELWPVLIDKLLPMVPSRVTVLEAGLDRKVKTIEDAQRRWNTNIDKLDAAKRSGKGNLDTLGEAVNTSLERLEKLLKESETLQREYEAAVRNNLARPSKLSTITKKQLVFLHKKMSDLFFEPPRSVKDKWNGVVTTDGVIASWHHVRFDLIKRYADENDLDDKGKRIKKPTKIIRVKDLRELKASEKPRYYGTHGKDCFVEKDNGTPLDTISVDPGRAILIAAIRDHDPRSPGYTGVPLPPAPHGNVSKSAKRRHAIDQKLAEQNRSKFILTNKQWQHQCGRIEMQQWERNLQKKLRLQPYIDSLAVYPAGAYQVYEYDNHIEVKLSCMEAMKTRAQAKAPSRWKFHCKQREELAAKKLAQDLIAGCRGNLVVPWGNGGFYPSGKGHASAPNKKLRRLLSKYLPIMLTTEHRSSQVSSCCHAPMKDAPRLHGRRRVVVKHCSKCSITVSRDLSAAGVISDAFQYQRQNQTDAMPPFLASPKKSKGKEPQRATTTNTTQ